MRSVRTILLACVVGILYLATVALATSEVAVPLWNPVDQARITAIWSDIAQLHSVQESVLPALPNKGTGNLYYVDSVAGSDTHDGTSWVKAKATVNAVVALCTANNGDVIFIAQGSTEDIAGAKGVYLNKAGITICGIGNGADAPSFTFSATGSTFAVGKANVKVYNCQFIPVRTDVAVGISVEATADYFSLIGCWFPEPTTSTWEFTSAILLATGADHVTVQDCVSYRTGATGATDWIDAATGIVDDLRIISNVAMGEYASGVFYSDEVLTNVLLANNCFVSLTTTIPAVKLTAAATGVAVNNYLVGDTWGTLGVSIFDPGALKCFGNLGATSADKSASPIPSISLGQTVFDWLGGADGLSTWPTAAKYANSVSFAEVLGYIQDAVRNGTGTGMAANKGVADALGTNGSTLVDDAVSIAGLIGIPTDADNAVASTAIVSNPDGSILERQEYQQKLAEVIMAVTGRSIAGSAMPLAVWYVDGGIAESGDGKSPAAAFQTIDEAIAVCSDSVDDWVLVFDYSGSTGTITINKSFIHLIGGGRNGDKPWARIKPSNDVAGITTVNGKGTIEIANFVLGGNTNHAAIEWAAGVVADSYYIHDCVFGWDSSSACLQGIGIAATADAPSLKVENCRFFESVSQNGILIAGNATKGLIKDNYFSNIGTATYPAIHVSSGGVGIRTEGNRIQVKTDGVGAAITLSASSENCWTNLNYANDGGDTVTNNPYLDSGTANGWGLNYADVNATLPD